MAIRPPDSNGIEASLIGDPRHPFTTNKHSMEQDRMEFDHCGMILTECAQCQLLPVAV